MFIMTQDRCTVRDAETSEPNPIPVSKSTPVPSYFSLYIYTHMCIYT